MTNLTKQKILEKLEIFNEYLGYLYQLKKESKNEKIFLSDFHLFGNAERYLHLSIQIIIDISHLIIIHLNLKRPTDNYEAISILFQNKIISDPLANKLNRMLGLRNVLVHEYGKIDRKKIYNILNAELQDLEEFKKQIIKFLKK